MRRTRGGGFRRRVEAPGKAFQLKRAERPALLRASDGDGEVVEPHVRPHGVLGVRVYPLKKDVVEQHLEDDVHEDELDQYLVDDQQQCE